MVLLKKEERVYIPIDALLKLAKQKGVAYVGTELPDELNPNVTKDEDGNIVKKIVRVETWDTPFLVPYGEQADPCPVHNPGYYENGEGEHFEVPNGNEQHEEGPKDDMVAY